MARIAGVNIPQNKVIHVALTYIHDSQTIYARNSISQKIKELIV
jgi:ribosomal protein S13